MNLCLISFLLLGGALFTQHETITPKGETKIKVYVFDTGLLETKDISVMFPSAKNERKTLSVPSYLIIHPKGTLLWDAGLKDSLHQFPNGLDIWGGSWNAKVKRTLKDQLTEISVDPSKVDYLAFSHFHSDHTGNASYFANSTLIIQKSASQIAFKNESISKGFNPDDYAHLKNQTRIINGDHDVFGDRSVVIISTPGHSEGHQMLYIDLPNHGPVLISGDLYILSEQRQHFWIPAFNINKAETIHSFSKIERFIERTRAKLWIQHDYNQFSKLKKAPLFYK